MPGYKNLSFTRSGGGRQTFWPKKEDPFHLPCQRFSDTEFFLMIFRIRLTLHPMKFCVRGEKLLSLWSQQLTPAETPELDLTGAGKRMRPQA